MPDKLTPAPVIAAADLAPAVFDPPVQLKTADAPASQPHDSNPQSAAPVVTFALPQPVAPSVTAVGAAQTPATQPTESSDDDSGVPLELGNLVFQLSLDPSEPSSQKPRVSPAEGEHEAASFLSQEEEISSNPQPQAGASGSETKNQDQQEQQQSPLLPQFSPTGPVPAVDGTIASQFGFQTPLSFAVQTAAPKAESVAAPAPARTAENIAPPELPMASSIDRVGLTIRGADDQVVRVEISQSGELVQVGVHTGNNDLASELRASVPDLMHRLDQQGFESRLSLPTLTSAAPVMASAHSEFRSGADTSGNPKSNGDAAPQEELRQQQRQRSPQRSWRELASQLQED